MLNKYLANVDQQFDKILIMYIKMYNEKQKETKGNPKKMKTEKKQKKQKKKENEKKTKETNQKTWRKKNSCM